MFPSPSSAMLLRSMGGVDPVQLTPTLAPLNAAVSNPFFPVLPGAAKPSNSQKTTRPGATPLQRAGSFLNFSRLNRRKPYPKTPKPPAPEPGSTILLLPENSSASEGSSTSGHRSGADPQTIIHIDITELVENEVQTPAVGVKKVRPSLLRGSPFFPTFSFQRRGDEEHGMGQGVGFVGGLAEAWRTDVEIERPVSQHVEEVEAGQEIEARDLPLEGQSTEPAESVGPWKAEFERQEEYRAEVLQGFSLPIQPSEAEEI
ncbi:hypothetical protein B0J14DRAFT_652543 [Halenospora varia]|nr:hypothetical protein B0J14DRAFT_652543 [Halenospora varia]